MAAGKSTLFKAIMGFVPVTAGGVEILGLAGKAALQAQSRRLCAAGRRGRLELPGARRGRGDDGPLRPHELAAHSVSNDRS
jgi:hypothetical protein